MPELAIEGAAADISIWPVEPEETRLIGLITQAKIDLSPAAEAMRRFIEEHLREV